MAAPTLRVKTTLGGDTRAFELARPSCSELRQNIKKLYGLDDETVVGLLFTYVDCDGDSIRFDRDDELAFAFALAASTSSLLRIIVSPPDGEQLPRSGGGTVQNASAPGEDAVMQVDTPQVEVKSQAPAPDDDENSSDSSSDSDDDENGDWKRVKMATPRQDSGAAAAAAAAAQKKNKKQQEAQALRDAEDAALKRLEEEAEADPSTSTLLLAACETLRKKHDVVITPVQLWTTLKLLQLPARRLVNRQLAPRALLKLGSSSDTAAAAADEKPADLNDKGESDSDDDEDNMEGPKVSGGNAPAAGGEGVPAEFATPSALPAVSALEAEDTRHHPVAIALREAGVPLAPTQPRRLLKALGVGPGRFVKLGVVKRDVMQAYNRGFKAGAARATQSSTSFSQDGANSQDGGSNNNYNGGERGFAGPYDPRRSPLFYPGFGPPHGPPHRRGGGGGAFPPHFGGRGGGFFGRGGGGGFGGGRGGPPHGGRFGGWHGGPHAHSHPHFGAHFPPQGPPPPPAHWFAGGEGGNGGGGGPPQWSAGFGFGGGGRGWYPHPQGGPHEGNFAPFGMPPAYMGVPEPPPPPPYFGENDDRFAAAAGYGGENEDGMGEDEDELRAGSESRYLRREKSGSRADEAAGGVREEVEGSEKDKKKKDEAEKKGEKRKSAAAVLVRFVRHGTMPDGTEVTPAQPFKKTWVVRNDAARPWPESCELIPVSGAKAFASAPAVPVAGGVRPGEDAEISAWLSAPKAPGRHEAFWRLREVGGKKFGQRLWTNVTVVPQATPVIGEGIATTTNNTNNNKKKDGNERIIAGVQSLSLGAQEQGAPDQQHQKQT